MVCGVVGRHLEMAQPTKKDNLRIVIFIMGFYPSELYIGISRTLKGNKGS